LGDMVGDDVKRKRLIFGEHPVIGRRILDTRNPRGIYDIHEKDRRADFPLFAVFRHRDLDLEALTFFADEIFEVRYPLREAVLDSIPEIMLVGYESVHVLTEAF